MNNEIQLKPCMQNGRVDATATLVTRRRNNVVISNNFVAGSVPFHTRRFVFGFDYEVVFAQKGINEFGDTVYLGKVR